MANGDLTVVIPDFLAKPGKGDKLSEGRPVPEKTYRGYTLKVFPGRDQKVTVCEGAKPVFFAKDVAAAQEWVDERLRYSTPRGGQQTTR